MLRWPTAIFNEAMILPVVGGFPEGIEEDLKRGRFTKADSIPELAAKCADCHRLWKMTIPGEAK